jgi:hypothetical protein
MPSIFTVASFFLLPTGAVLAGSFLPAPADPALLRRTSCKMTYYSQNGDTCATMDKMYGLASGTTLAANPSLTCSDVWPGTPICVPDGPYACSQTYSSKKGDTCDSLEQAFNMPSGAILAANTFLTCSDIWEGTPICIPNGSPTPSSTTTAPGSTPTTKACKSTYYSSSGDTCDSLDKAYNLVSGSVQGSNSFVTCNNIWAGTPLCIPDGPYAEDIGCTIQTYYSQPNDTCTSIESAHALVPGDVKADNSYVDCNNIWSGTPLVICVPPQADHGCTKTVNSWDCATCDDIGAAYGISGTQIQAWNTFVDCNDIWTNTPICVAH